MFGSTTLFEDEFRLLLKRHLGFSEETNDVGSEQTLAEFARLVGSAPNIVRGWTQGVARPTPREERSVIALLKGLNNFV